MSVSLVHHTNDGDNLIAYMARVSNPSNQNNNNTAPKLIKYLIKHGHWSPLEMVSMCVSIKTTRSISAQLIRHRSFSFQEFSQRYAEVTEIPQVPELRRQDPKNRQNSIPFDNADTKEFSLMIEQYYQQGVFLYNSMLQAGVAKECARDVLPMASPTMLYMNGSARSWYHYLALRLGNGTQKEHMEIAKEIYIVFRECFPVLGQILQDELTVKNDKNV